MPQVWTDFRRVTLLGIRTKERVTIDLELGVSKGPLERSLGGVAIVEVKQWPFSRATPVMGALRDAGRRPGWFGKYCVAIALTRPEVRLTRLIRCIRAVGRAS